jgi:hypothetical protein
MPSCSVSSENPHATKLQKLPEGEMLRVLSGIEKLCVFSSGRAVLTREKRSCSSLDSERGKF